MEEARRLLSPDDREYFDDTERRIKAASSLLVARLIGFQCAAYFLMKAILKMPRALWDRVRGTRH